MNGEEWRPAPGFLNLYLVSSLGRVRNISPRRGNGLLFGEADKDGYRRVNLAKGGKPYKRIVHRLVCEAFHGPPPQGCEAAHRDGNPKNNAAGNIAWMTHAKNNDHKRQHGTHQAGEKHPRAKLTAEQVERIRASDKSSRAAGLEFGVHQSQIVRIRTGARW